MNQILIDKIVQAVLYEGYILYPYRRGTKNHQRWTFGSLFPREYSQSSLGGDPYLMQVQCLLRADELATVSIHVRFLQLIDRQVCQSAKDGSISHLEEIEIDGRCHQSWQEAVERTVSVDLGASGNPLTQQFKFPADRSTEPLRDRDGHEIAALVRTQAATEGAIECASSRIRDDLYQITVRILNQTPVENDSHPNSRSMALLHSMASTHTILTTSSGGFLSLIDPPADADDLARQCHNIGIWPVLVGDAGATDALLASPIILYDYPQIAPESPGDLFDGTEIDEILSLRIMTLTDEEKRAAGDLDNRTAAMLRRTESLARDQLARLHGTMRSPPKIQAVHVADAELRAGDRVRLRPRGRADAFDIILRGKTATIAAIEQDYENRIHLAVTIDDDPGADIGAAGKIGHRFYFHLDEVEPIRASEEVPAR